MIYSPSSSVIYPTKGFLDDTTSKTISTVSYKITRKQDQSSTPRRPSKKSSQSSLERLDFSRLYVKMPPNEQKMPQTMRATLIKRNSQMQRIKRRSPTPVHSRKGKADAPKKDQQQQMQKDLLILELQQKGSDERKEKESLERILAVCQKQLNERMKIIEELQSKNADLMEKRQMTSKKLLEYQEIASTNESSLNEARNSLEKLKSIIKKNRCQQLEVQNSKLIKQNTHLSQQIAVSALENAKNKQNIARLEENIMQLRRENQQLVKGSQLKQKNLEIEKLRHILNASKSQKEEQLERLIIQKSQAEKRQRLHVEKLEIQLAYLNRKKNEEIQQLKLKHGSLFNKLRNKICVLREQYSELREQHQQVKLKGVAQFPRRSLLLTDHRPTEDLFLFDLSP